MKISDLFGRTGVYGNSKTGAASKQSEDGTGSNGISSSDSDRMTISSKARLLSEVSKMRDAEEQKQSARVAALKKLVEAGEYNVSSDEVAGKIDSFFRAS